MPRPFDSMISRSDERAPRSTADGLVRPATRRLKPNDEVRVYDTSFWLTYAANTLTMTAIAILFRYSDFIVYLGGREFILGWIVGVGMVGSLLMRAAQGVGIDKYGPRRIWLISLTGFIISCVAHLAVHDVDGPMIFAVRVLYNTSFAGVFGASITYISSRVPVARLAEVVGILGTSGFIGIVSGAMLGDLLLGHEVHTRWELERMFLTSAGLGACAFVLAWLATRGDTPPVVRRRLPLTIVLWRYRPGFAVLAVGITMGVGLGMPNVYLRPFAAELGIHKIATFFTVYSITAFVTRVRTRHLPESLGIRPVILAGLGCLITSVLTYLLVHTQWQLVIPAVFAGGAHALLFPAVIAGGSSSFPIRNRGTGTTLMLATFDLGNLIGGPLIGGLLRVAENARQPRYPVMFLCLAVLFVGVAAYFAWSTRGTKDRPRGIKRSRNRQNGRSPAVTASAEGIKV